MSSIEFDAEDEDIGQRVDIVVIRHLERKPETSSVGRARAKSLFDEGAVRINGHRVKKGIRVQEGDRIEIAFLPVPADFAPLPVDHPDVQTLFEDPHMVVVCKPSGMSSHPLRPDETDTAANVIAARWPDTVGIGRAEREAGLVHRLDHGTSGILVAARDASTFDLLVESIVNARLDKRYLALCHGRVTPRLIDYPIAPVPGDRSKMMVLEDDRDFSRRKARRAQTEIVAVEEHGEFSLCEVRARRAGRHQIRVHLSALGFPLDGDTLYGGTSSDLGTHFLHASSLVIPEDIAQEIWGDGRPEFRVDAELPGAHAAYLAKLSR